jgi:23S rRNA (cytosine1962-C5)-methyltransferase
VVVLKLLAMNDIQLQLPEILDGEDKSSPFINSIRKNYRHIRKFAKRTTTDCFRIYDREVRGYPLAIDFYAGRFCVHYFSPYHDSEDLKQELVDETEKALFKLFGTLPAQIFWRTRIKAKLTRQYEKTGASGAFFTSYEYGVKFKINLEDYLDTGLFLDHRESRQLIANLSDGKRLLNLFAYTCSFSIHAAMHGAIYTKSVDMSNTYTDWGRDNFILNGISLKNHDIVRADCLKFLDQEISCQVKYDLIVIDPPTISRSKKMDQLFDVNVDYINLINKSLKLLLDGGVIFFSTNSRKFNLHESLFPFCTIIEVSSKTLPIDFHDKKIHRAWKIFAKIKN